MPSSLKAKERFLILDTGPIREMVTFHAVEQYGFEGLRGELQFIRDSESYALCSKFIASFLRKTTSASVVAELNYWIQRTDRTGRVRLWNRVHEEFREMGMDEEVVKLLEMASGEEVSLALLTRLGPVDLSLMHLARRHGKEGALLLTSDRPLCTECAQAGVHVVHLQDVISTRL